MCPDPESPVPASSPLIAASRLRAARTPPRDWDLEKVAFVGAQVIAGAGIGIAFSGFGWRAASVLLLVMAWAASMCWLMLKAAARARR